jgi:hypothetical protein
VLPKRVNAVSATICTDGRFMLTIGSGDCRTQQYVFTGDQLKMLVEEAVRVYTAELNETPFSA